MDNLQQVAMECRDLSYGKFFIISAIIIIGILARKIFSGLVVKAIGQRVSQGVFLFSPEHLQRLVKPLSLTFVIGSLYLAQSIADLPLELKSLLNHSLQSVAALTFFWMCLTLVDPIKELHRERHGNSMAEVREFLSKSAKVLIFVVGILTTFQVWGKDVTTFLAGLGLFGMAVALAAQDTIKNIFACVAILMDKTFHKGDMIKTNEVEGIVEAIGFRTTLIRQLDKALVHIPNHKLADAAVINFAKMTNRRVRWEIGITYSTPAASLERIVKRIREYLEEHPEIESNPKRVITLVNFDCFADSSINLLMNFFSKSTDIRDFMRTKEECLLAVKRIVEEEGGDFAFPTRSVHIENFPQNIPCPVPKTIEKKETSTKGRPKAK